MQKPEIKLIITSLAPEPVHHHGRTGGDVRLTEIFRRFSRTNGIKIFVVSTPYNRKYFENNGIRADFKIVGSRFRFRSLAGLFFKSILTILKMFFLKLDFLESKDRKVIVYSSSDLFWETIPAFFFKMRKKNIRWIQAIYHIYPDWKKRPGSKAMNFFGYYLQRFSFLLIKNKADKVVLINNIVKNDLKKIGFSENKMLVSSNGIDSDYFENMEGVDLKYDGVFLARLSHSKGITDLIEIWKYVCREIPGAKLAVIGGGNEETKNFLQKKIKGYNLENNIDLLGFLADNEAHPILKSGKVFLFPSHEEGWGIAVAEAMACGLPVVSWDLPVFREIFENYTMQVKEDDISAFSESILGLLKDKSKRNRLGNNGKEFIKKYSWEDVAGKELEIFCS